MRTSTVLFGPTGRLRWIHANAMTRRGTTGRPNRMVGVNFDITERRKAEQALHHAKEQLQRWAVELEEAVNVKTAELQRSQGRLRALASELNLAEQRERKRLAAELHDHLQQMLVFGKLTLGQGKRAALGIPACEQVMKKVDDMLSDALTYTRTLVAELSPPVLRNHGLPAGLKWLGEYMKKHDQTVTVLVPEQDDLTLPEDQVILLFQSVRELLINSSKYAGTGQATVRLTGFDDRLEITVSDEGKGFELGAVSGASGDELSSKFGLFSIRERMRVLGGRFDLDSAPGRGTTATLALPLAGREERDVRDKRDAQTSTSEPVSLLSPVSRVSQHANCRVLLVDDHAMVRQGLRSVLDAYTDIQVVGEARDGSEAVHLVGELRPRVVVMDINMPRMNGIEATVRIKTLRPETIVIGISVNTGHDTHMAMKQAGAVALLTKEAAVDDLYAVIRREATDAMHSDK